MAPTRTSAFVSWVSSYCLSGGFLVKCHGKGEKPRQARGPWAQYKPEGKWNLIWLNSSVFVLLLCLSWWFCLQKCTTSILLFAFSPYICFPKRSLWPIYFSLNSLTSHIYSLIILIHLSLIWISSLINLSMQHLLTLTCLLDLVAL